MSVDTVSRKHDRIPFTRFLGVYLPFQWRRQCARLHRVRIALYSRRLGPLIRRRADISADQSAPASVTPVVPVSATQGSNDRYILIIDTVPPRPDCDAGSLRCHHLMRLMVSLGYTLVLHCEERLPSAAEVTELRAIGIETTLSPVASPPGWSPTRNVIVPLSSAATTLVCFGCRYYVHYCLTVCASWIQLIYITCVSNAKPSCVILLVCVLPQPSRAVGSCMR